MEPGTLMKPWAVDSLLEPCCVGDGDNNSVSD